MLTVVEILSSRGGIATPWQEDKHTPVTDIFTEWKRSSKIGYHFFFCWCILLFLCFTLHYKQIKPWSLLNNQQKIFIKRLSNKCKNTKIAFFIWQNTLFHWDDKNWIMTWIYPTIMKKIQFLAKLNCLYLFRNTLKWIQQLIYFFK